MKPHESATSDPARLTDSEPGKAIGSADPDRLSSSVDATARPAACGVCLGEGRKNYTGHHNSRGPMEECFTCKGSGLAAPQSSSVDAVQARVHQQEAIEEAIDFWRNAFTEEHNRLKATEARVHQIEQERDHERHEKETVADAMQAHGRWSQAKRAELEARVSHLEQENQELRKR